MENNYQKFYDLLLKDKIKKSDAVIWLQGDRLDRGDKVLEIYKFELAKLVVISGNDILIGPKMRPGENNISLGEMKKYLMKNGISKKDIIVDYKSFNTKEQAIHLVKLSKQKKWERIIIVSSVYNQPRAFLSFVKATQIIGYKVEINNQCVNMGENVIASGRKATNKKLIEEEKIKILNYQLKGDIASYQEGFDYLRGNNIEKNKFKFRLISINDADTLLKWRNDSETRKWSHNVGIVKKSDHVKWLTDSLKNNNRKIYIVEYKKDLVGTIRTDKKDRTIELSWTVAPEARGRGIGKEMIAFFVSRIKVSVRAEIKVGNEASKKIAEYSDMKFDYEKNGILYYSRLVNSV